MQILASLWLAAVLQSAAAEIPPAWRELWPETDFASIVVDPGEIVDGGVTRDTIPPLAAPSFLAARAAEELDPDEPMMVLEMPGELPRAYPLRYLAWHEVINDHVGDIPVAVTFCPLCNAAAIYDRRHDGQVLEFALAGLVRKRDILLYDRQSESWWQQFSGRAIVGTYAGNKLARLPSWLETVESFRARHPDGLVMAAPTGTAFRYGRDPYGTRKLPVYRGEDPPHGIDPLARVVRVGQAVWPLRRLMGEAQLEEEGLVFHWAAGDTGRGPGLLQGIRRLEDLRVVRADGGDPVAFELLYAYAFRASRPRGKWMVGP